MLYIFLALALQVVGFLTVLRITKSTVVHHARDSTVPRDFATLDQDEKDLP